jgi:peptidyl-dipeptidase A
VPELLPADWLPNRWGQDWSAMVNVQGLSLEDSLRKKSAEWVVRRGEDFYKSLGFDALPASFYQKSSLYPLAPGTAYKKNTHASAWHMDLADDVRSLMSVEPNGEWWETTLHELGHVYYYRTYTNPDVPLILRRRGQPGLPRSHRQPDRAGVAAKAVSAANEPGGQRRQDRLHAGAAQGSPQLRGGHSLVGGRNDRV